MQLNGLQVGCTVFLTSILSAINTAIFTSFPIRLQSYYDQCVCLLFAYLKNHMSKLYKIFCNVTYGLPITTMQCIVHFKFCG